MDERKAFEAAYNAINPITSTRETAWLCWRAATLAERERAAKVCEAYQVPVGNSAAGEMAADWTTDALREVRDAIRKG